MNAHLLALGSVLVVNMNKDSEIKKKKNRGKDEEERNKGYVWRTKSGD